MQVFDCAIGESNGNISFNIYPKGFCNPGMSSKYMETPLTRKITVAQKTIDSFIHEHNISKVDFLKMDIQGAEMDLLKGASGTISKHRPAIFLEALAMYNDTKALYEKFREYNYNVYIIGEESLLQMHTVGEVKGRQLAWLCINGNGIGNEIYPTKKPGIQPGFAIV